MSKRSLVISTALYSIITLVPGVVSAEVVVSGSADGISSGATASTPAKVRIGVDGSDQVGTGSVTVSNGATVSSDGGFEVGTETGSDGTVTITGSGSSWTTGTSTVDGHIEVGRRGSVGALTVTDGGRLETVKGGIYSGTGATLLFTGVGTTVDIGSLSSNVEPNVTTWGTAAGWLGVGGKMTVSDGAEVRSDGGYIGGIGLNLAEVTVDGTGTRWDNELPLYIGGNGNGVYNRGRLTVSGGANVTAYTIAAGVDVGCPTDDTDETDCAPNEQNAEGDIVITGVGSRLESRTNSNANGNIRIGFNGTGSLTLSDGGTVSNLNAAPAAVFQIATNDGSIGVVSIGGKLADGPAKAGFITVQSPVTFGMGEAKLVFNHTELDYTFGADLQQTVTGGLRGNSEIIHAAGTTIYTGDGSKYEGLVSVRGGVFRVNDVLNGTLTVKNGSELGGRGSVGDVTVESGGTLRPGDTETEFTLSAASLALKSGSKTLLDWNPTAASASLMVADSATIDNGAILDVTFAPGTLVKLTDKHHVLSLSNTAVGNVNGNFTLGTDSQSISRFLGLSLENDATSPDDVYLSVEQTAQFDAVGGLNRRQSAVAEAAAGLSDGSDLQALLLNLQTDEEALVAFSSLYGDVHEHQVAANLRGMSLAAHSVISRMGGKSRLDDNTIDSNRAVWGTALYSRDTSSLNDVDATSESVTTGLVAGADLFEFADWTLGAYVSFQNGETSGNAQSSSQENKIVGLYAGTRGAAVNASLGLGVGMSSGKSTRMISLSQDVADGAPDGTYVQAFGELSKTFGIRKNGFVEPFARLSLTQGQTDAFNESGSVGTLSVGAGDFSESAGQIGVRSEVSVSGAEGTARYFGSIALESVSRTGSFNKTFADGGSIQSVGLDGTTSQVAFRLGTTYDFNGAGNLSLAYDGRVGEHASDGALSISFMKQF